MNYFLDKKRAMPAAAGIAFFAAISYFVMTQDTLAFDTIVREYIYGLRSDGLTAFFTIVTYLGNWQTITLICCGLLVFPKFRLSFGIPMSVTAVLATSIQKVLKSAFHRQRPELSLHLIQQGGYSFPSGHSFTILVFYGLIIFLCRKNIKDKRVSNLITILLSCLIFLIGFSRIYLGVHYPTDVLGGWILGFSFLMLFISSLLFLQRVKK